MLLRIESDDKGNLFYLAKQIKPCIQEPLGTPPRLDGYRSVARDDRLCGTDFRLIVCLLWVSAPRNSAAIIERRSLESAQYRLLRPRGNRRHMRLDPRTARSSVALAHQRIFIHSRTVASLFENFTRNKMIRLAEPNARWCGCKGRAPRG